MSRKSSGFTGANAVPLGPRNPAIGSKRGFSSDPPQSLLNPPAQQTSHGSGNMMSSFPNQPQSQVSSNAANALRAAQAAAAALSKIQQKKPQDKPPEPQAPPPQDDGRGRPRKKRSRWSTPENKTEIPGIPAKIPANLSNEQQKIYIVQLQIEDVTRKLKSGDLGIPANPEDRSPSPEPIYNNEGKRLNTREYRTRKRLEEERHKLIQDMVKLNENYKPPMDYKPPMQRISEQIMIPADLNPSINFVGLLIGPRGNTLKKIEKECQCKIMIRGKGSVKEGKIGRKDGMPLPGEDEPLHALITGNTIENVQKASKEIHTIIKQGIEQPEGQNDLRKLQLMELARLNGTLRDDAMPREREWLKPENQNVTNTTVCTKCGGRGHIAQDCMATPPSVELQQQSQVQGGAMNEAEKAKMDSEYLSLMAELGEGPGPGNPQGNDQSNNQYGGQKPPWMSDQSPQPLMSTPVNPTFGGSYNGQNMMGGPPPWMRGNSRGRGNYPPRGGRGRGGYRGGGNNNNYQGGYGHMGDGMGGGMWMNQQYDPNMYNNMDGSMGAPGMMAPPPPPPPGNAPQQPPLPPGSNNGGSWQNQWNSGSDKTQEEGGHNEEGDYPDGPPGAGNENMGGNNMSGGNMGSNMQGGGDMQGGMGSMQGGMGSMQGGMGNMQGGMGMQGNMGGYGNMMGYGMWGGMGNMGSGMGQPPMPPGPGPVPPPPPTSGASTTQSGNNQWDYNNMGGNMNMMGGMGMMPFGMPPAPPPPPPSS